MSAETNAVLEAITRLEARLERLERKLDALPEGAGLEDAPTEMLDLSASAPELPVTGVEERLERFDNALEMLETLATRLPTIADAAASVAVYAVQEAAARDIDVLALGERSLELATKAAQADKLDLADELLDASGDLALAMAARRKLHAQLGEAGTSLENVVDASTPAAVRLAKLMTTPGFAALLESGVLDESSLQVVAKAGDALVETQTAGSEALGAWGLFRALQETEVQKAAGFGIAFARRFGGSL